MRGVEKIEPFGKEGELRMIVETPRGSTVKLRSPEG
jgi:hypothetical protein